MWMCLHKTLYSISIALLTASFRLDEVTGQFRVISNGTVRLRNGGASYQGRVEVAYKGQFYTVCDDKFDRLDAAVVCKQLGFSNSATAVLHSKFHHGAGRILLDDLHCTGSEANLLQCKRDTALFGSNCEATTETAGVICDGRKTGSLRLVGESQSNLGRLEIYVSGQWHTICDDQFSLTEAEVACKQLGYPGVATMSSFGAASTAVPVLTRRIKCTGGQTNISQCLSPMNTLTCSHNKDVGVICVDEYGSKEGSLRLQGGSSHFTGRLEIYHDSHWGTVCEKDWSKQAADVACRQMNYSEASSAFLAAVPPVPNRYSRIWVSELGCTGREAGLMSCASFQWGNKKNCVHDNDVGITCKYACRDLELRLRGTQLDSKGYLQVKKAGKWYNACTYGWSPAYGQVVCRALGFAGFLRYHTVTYSISTPTKLQTYGNCKGNENCLSECKNHGWQEASSIRGPTGLNFCYDINDRLLECKVFNKTTGGLTPPPKFSTTTKKDSTSPSIITTEHGEEEEIPPSKVTPGDSVPTGKSTTPQVIAPDDQQLGPPIGPIIGGILAALLIVIIIIVVFIILRRHAKSSKPRLVPSPNEGYTVPQAGNGTVMAYTPMQGLRPAQLGPMAFDNELYMQRLDPTVATVLKSTSLERYAPTFARSGITRTRLETLTTDDLATMGIPPHSRESLLGEISRAAVYASIEENPYEKLGDNITDPHYLALVPDRGRQEQPYQPLQKSSANGQLMSDATYADATSARPEDNQYYLTPTSMR